MPKLESGIHHCHVCDELLVTPDKISHRINEDGSTSFRHLWHGSTNLLKETNVKDYSTSLDTARIRAEELLKSPDISEQTRLEETIILAEVERLTHDEGSKKGTEEEKGLV